jgi:hypothetical protein
MKELDGINDCPEQQMILYVEKEDGQYGPVQTGSYISANYLDDFFYKRKNLEAALIRKVQTDEISPIHYFMILEDLTLSELASRAGIWKWKVKRHLKPSFFHKISCREMNRYSAVFNVNADEIRKLGLPEKETTKNES